MHDCDHVACVQDCIRNRYYNVGEGGKRRFERSQNYFILYFPEVNKSTTETSQAIKLRN